MAIGGAQELLQFLITANGQQAIQEINAVGKAATRQEQLIAKTNKKSAAAYTALGAKQVAFGLAATAGVVAAASAAADLDKSISRVNATYGAGADEVTRWAENANKVFLSDRQAANYAADVGEAAQGLGVAADEATRLVPEVIAVTAQLATLKGLDMDNSIESVSAALRGEFDATQRLIPALSKKRIVDEALVASGKERASDLTTQEQALATLNIILNDGTEIIEGNAEALDSLSARWAETKSNIDDAVTGFGKGALPAVEGLAGAARVAAEGFSAIPAPLLKVAGGLAGIGAAGSIAVGGLNLVRGGIEKMRPALVRVAANVLALPKAFGALGALATGGILAGVAAGIYLIATESARAERKAKDLTAAIESFKKAAAVDDEIESWKQLERAAADSESTFDSFADWTFGEGAAVEIEGVRIELENLDNLIADLGSDGDYEALEGVLRLLESIDLDALQEGGFLQVDEVSALQRSINGARNELGLLEESGQGAADGLGEVGDAGEDAADGVDKAAEAAERLSDALSAFDAVSAVTEGMLAQAEAAQAIAEAEAALEEARSEGDPAKVAEAQRELTKAYLEQQAAAVDLVGAVDEAARLGPQALQDLRAAIFEGAANGLIPGELAAQTIAQIDGIVQSVEGKEVELGLTIEQDESLEATAQGEANRFRAAVEASPSPKVPVEADTDPAQGELNRFKTGTAAQVAEVQISGDTAPAEERTQWVYDYVSGLWVEMPVGADTSEADQKNNALRGRVSRGVTVPVDADTSAAERKIYGLNGKRITLSAAVNRIEGVPGAGAVAAPEAGGIAGPGIEVDLSGLFGKGASLGSGSSPTVGTYVRSQTINLPRGADAREVELAQRRYSARNGSPRR